jgi:hypothetical protein
VAQFRDMPGLVSAHSETVAAGGGRVQLPL